MESGIWREFEGQPDLLGVQPFRVTHALQMSAKTIYLLSAESKSIRSFSITSMSFSELSHLELPPEMDNLFATLQAKTGVHYLFDNKGDVYLLNGPEQSIGKKCSLLEPRRKFSIALSPCASFIYAIGGVSLQGTYLSTVERYDLESDRWDCIQSLAEPLVDSVAVTMPDGIYLFGGTQERGSCVSQQVSRFDTVTNRAQKVCQMRIARSGFTACSSSKCD
mmetsp:Transcript_2096/g.2930  ORF Transcript_2096/g.2930 Transcript_2096/m.2930 type:complete len:221 (+) Transcript_2096:608-1270(+)